MPGRTTPLVAALLVMAMVSCDEPRHPDANSAHVAAACLDAVRADAGDSAATLENGNHANIDGGIVTAPFLIAGDVVSYRCAFTFDTETQRYTTGTVVRANR